MAKLPLNVTTQVALDAFSEKLAKESAIAVDTESDSLYSYFGKVCLVQVSRREADYIVNPLSMSEIKSLGLLFANPQIEKILHAAEYDILCLKRDHQFSFNNIFDTMIAARILGWKN